MVGNKQPSQADNVSFDPYSIASKSNLTFFNHIKALRALTALQPPAR